MSVLFAGSVDTSSIIERKEATKEYWKHRMMADQGLLEDNLLTSDDSTKVNQCKLNPNSSEQRNYGILRKLGSDGESETSPESSLSPLEVDSLEEGGSDGRQSTEATDTDVLLECVSQEQQGDQLLSVDIPTFNEKSENCLAFCFPDADINEREELSTVDEEEQEPDSLEEFIKHENECMKDEDLAVFEKSVSKENVYEEIGNKVETLTLHNERPVETIQTKNLIDFDIETCVTSQSSENQSLITIECDLRSESMRNAIEDKVANGLTLEKSSETFETMNDTANAFRESQMQTEADSVQQTDSCKPHIIGQTYQHLLDVVSATKQSTEVKKVENVNEKDIVLKSTENKIAEEIREQKLREDELRRMREEIQLKQINLVDTVVVKNLPAAANMNGHVGGRASPTISEMSSTGSSVVSSDSLDNCSSRSSDRIKVRPYSCEEEISFSSAYKVLNESPIEKEIRMGQEREEALRLEKSLLSKSFEVKDCLKKSQQQTAATKSPILKSLSTSSANPCNIQKVLATTRIQQEIEEQTQREIELRAKGSIKTISQERTDIKVTKLGDFDRKTRVTQSLSVSPASTVGESESQEMPSLPLQNTVTLENKALKRKTSLPQILGFGALKNISMHKFISSKGKTANSNASFSFLQSATDEFDILRPPQILKGVKGIRRAVPAESKIQEELKEMKAREEELKWQRARLLGKSQPNLATLEKDVNEQLRTEVKTEKLLNGNLLKRTASIPNIVEDDETKPQVCQLSAQKKKNPLIEQWELKIQKFVKMKK